MTAELEKIDVMESVLAKNEVLAAELNRELTSKGVLAVNVMGAPGAGKTSALISIINRLAGCCFVIQGDIASDIDTQKMAALGIGAVQINTGGACHLDSPLIKAALESAVISGGFLFIENIGNLVCPAEFMIGEHIKMLVSSVAEGADKPYKYPLAFEKADVILLNKYDLLPFTDFDEDYFMRGVARLNAKAPVFMVSARTGDGFDEAAEWLEQISRARFA